MSDSLRRFFVPQLTDSALVPSDDLVHYARDVLRLPHGAEVQLFDGQGLVVKARLELGSKPSLVVLERHRESTLRAAQVTMAVPLLKGPRQDWLVEKLSELGACRLLPLVTERSQLRELSQAKRERFARLVGEAARQAHNNHVLEIGPVTTFDELVREATQPLIALSMLAANDLDSLLHETLASNDRLIILIGPEGGLTTAESQQLATLARVGRLGSTVLRSETAALAAAALAITIGGAHFHQHRAADA